jgi:hypothetical protein
MKKFQLDYHQRQTCFWCILIGMAGAVALFAVGLFVSSLIWV